MSDASIEIHDRPERSQYVLLVDGEPGGFVAYRLRGDRMTIDHTEVDEAHAGRGLGGRLVRHVLDDARARGLRVIPRCPFTAGYIRTHPAYQDLVDAA
ncbi:MAG: GNAT family N-acetyltransferase [Candidatus Limnocylindrales bacterium]